MITFLDFILFILPSLTGFSAAWLFPVSQTENRRERLKLNLPSWLFGVVWTVLYLLIGFAWVRANRRNPLHNIAFALLVTSLVAWIVVNYYSEVCAIAILVMSIALSLACSQLQNFMLTPLTAWLVFALQLSMLKYCRET